MLSYQKPENVKSGIRMRKPWSPEAKFQQSVRMKEIMNRPETKVRHRDGHNTPEAKANHSAAAKEVRRRPVVEAGRNAALANTWADPNSKLNSEEANAKRRAAREGKTYEEIMGEELAAETREKQRVNAVERWARAEIRACILKGMNHPKVKAKQRTNQEQNWQNPEYVSKQMIARGVRPNVPEKFLDRLFQQLFPNQIKYTGDGKDKDFIIAGKCPDFVFTGRKKIIEFFGDFWHGEERTGIHNKQHEQERIELFAKYGYQALVIWEYELKDLELLLEKITNFLGID